MSVIYSDAKDSFVTNAVTNASWNHAQGSSTTDGDFQRSDIGFYAFGVYTGSFGSRGANDYRCYRSYFLFDLSS